MNTKRNFRTWSWLRLNKRRAARTGILLLLLALPVVVQAQFNYIITNGTVTITGYTGPGGAVTIPSTIAGLPVTSIGAFAFYQRTSLTSVTIPDSVTGIGNQAFETCTSLASVTIPYSVTSIGDAPFDHCPNLNVVTVDPLNSVYSSVGGVIFNKSQTTLIVYPGGKPGAYTIPYGVTNIAYAAFLNCSRLTSVSIPVTVVTIGESAFNSCTGLTNVVIGNGVATIGTQVFNSCWNLTTITIPNSVTSIGFQAFAYCGLTRIAIPDSVTNVEARAIEGCPLTSAWIGRGVTGPDLGYAFIWCSRLEAITVDNLNQTYSSVDGVLFNKARTTLVHFGFPEGKGGSYAIPNGVTNIEYAAFEYCSSLTNATIPDSVTSIGDQAFYDCPNLTGVYFTGNAPSLDVFAAFNGDTNVTIYYPPWTTGWGPTFGGRPTALWLPPLSPRAQTAEVGSGVEFRVNAGGGPVRCEWFLNGTSRLSCTNSVLQLPAVQYSQAGAYTVVVTNAAGAVTSPPALLSVIAPVPRRTVAALTLTGQTESLLNLDARTTLDSSANWETVDIVSLTNAPQLYFDLTVPVAPQRFYRVWQTNVLSPPSIRDVHLVPAITLTGAIGSSVRVDCINQFGPVDAWVTLDTVTLTSSPQLYFDTSVIGQPPRLWRIVPVP